DRQNRQVLLTGRLSFHLDQSSEAKHVNADAWGEFEVHGIVQQVVVPMTAPDLTQQIERPVAGHQQLVTPGLQMGFRRHEPSLRLHATVSIQFCECGKETSQVLRRARMNHVEVKGD
ncbi:MAG: hypothetical protein NT090_22880, partial [Acidobacteria bacterium]|nr:hypothetical protein [Acidobacteriota bacterium]